MTTTSKTPQHQLQSKSSTSVLLSSHAAQSKSETSISGGTSFSTVSTTSPSAGDAVSLSVTAGSQTPSNQVAVIGGQRIVLTGGSIVSQGAVGASTLKPGQSLSKFVVVPSGGLALSGQKQPLLVTGGGGAAAKLVKLPLQLQQSQQQPGKVMLSSGQVISGQPTIVRTATGQHFIIHSGAATQETPASAAAVLAAQHGASSPDTASTIGATQSLLTSSNSLASSVNLSTSPSAVSPTKYTVTPQVLQQGE